MTQLSSRNFTGGELAPSVRKRVDLQKYTSALAYCENFLIKPQGGLYNRPGTKFVGELDDQTARARLIPFSFNTEQTYMLVFEDALMRVVKDGAFVLDGGGPSLFELVTPYSTADLPRLVFTQSADVMTITHPDHDPMDLSRLADDDWTIEAINFAPQIDPPVIGGSNVTVNISNITKTFVAGTFPYYIDYEYATVTTSSDHGYVDNQTIDFASIGGMTELNGNSYNIELVDNDTFIIKGGNSFTNNRLDVQNFGDYTSGGTAGITLTVAVQGSGAGSTNTKDFYYVVTAILPSGEESLPSPVYKFNARELSETYGIKLAWTTVEDADYYRVYKDPSSDTGVYGWIGDTRKTVFTDFNIAPVTSDAPPEDNQPFNTVDNKPAVVGYYQQRRVFANTNNSPTTVFNTQTGFFASMRQSRPTRDDDAVIFTLSARQVNEIRHIVSINSLILLTSGGEWLVTEGRDQVLIPSTVGARPQSFNGSSWVTPVVVNDTVLYVQESGGKVRDLGYNINNDQYTGTDLSILAEHLFEGNYQIEEMAFAQNPYGIVWCVRNDGTLLGLTYQRDHQVWGWHHHVTDGEFESVATVREGSVDATYVIVKRTINGGTKRYVERFVDRSADAAEDAFFVDCGLTYDGAAATNISGLDHLEGEDVAVLADGLEVTGLTVSSGAITLATAASKVHVGLPYTAAIETLGIDMVSDKESISAKRVSVSQVAIEFEKSSGGYIGPVLDNGSSDMLAILPRYPSEAYDPDELATYEEKVNVQPDWGRDGRIRIEQRSPLPMAILSITPDVTFGD